MEGYTIINYNNCRGFFEVFSSGKGFFSLKSAEMDDFVS